MRNLTAGVIGGGNVAQGSHIPSYIQHPNIESVVVAELDDTRREEIVEEFAVSRIYADGKKLLEREELDLLSICTPPNTHERFFMSAAEQGTSIYCEKPVAPSLNSVQRMANKANEHDIITQVGYTRPYVKNFRKVLEFNDNKLLGDIFNVKTILLRPPPKSTWYFDPEVAGGGVIMEQFTHMIDFYLRIFDSQPTIERADLRQNRTRSVEDFAEVEFDFNGTKVTTSVAWGDHPATPGTQTNYYQNVLHAENGHLEYNMDHLTGTIHGNRFEFKHGTKPMIRLYSLLQLWGRTNDDFRIRRINDFVDHVLRGDHNTVVPIERAVSVHKIIDSIYNSQ